MSFQRLGRWLDAIRDATLDDRFPAAITPDGHLAADTDAVLRWLQSRRNIPPPGAPPRSAARR